MSKDIVTEMINNWLTERPTRSITNLMKLSGLSDSTLRRAQAGQTKPALETIVSIGTATGQRDQMLAAVEKHYPNCLNVLSNGKMSAGEPVEFDANEFLEPGTSTLLLLSLFTKKGLTRASVTESYGSTGNTILNKLVESGIAKEIEPGRIVPEEQWHCYRTPDEVLRLIRNLSLSFDKSLIGSEFARMGVLAESVSDKAAARIQAIMDDAIVEVRKVMDEPASIGDSVVAVSMLMQAIK